MALSRGFLTFIIEAVLCSQLFLREEEGTPGAIEIPRPGTLSLCAGGSGSKFVLRVPLALTKNRRPAKARPGYPYAPRLWPCTPLRCAAALRSCHTGPDL